MRIAGFSDAHLPGAGLPGASSLAWRQEDFLGAFHRAIDEILAYKPDIILFAGDAFQSRTPGPRWVREFALGLKALSEGAPTCVVPGNHDLTSWGSIIDALMVMSGYKNLYYLSEPSAKEIDGAQVFGMPWVTGRHLAAQMGETDTDREMESLARIGINAFLARPFDGPRIFVGHLTTLGGEFGGFVPASIGHEIFWQSSWLDGFDAALLGHLHRHQFPDPSRPWICYAGSTERLDFGERDETKGWVSIDLADVNPTWEFHPVYSRPMIQVEMKSIQEPFPDIHPDAILKVIMHLEAGQHAPDIEADCKYILPPTYIWPDQARRIRCTDDMPGMAFLDRLRFYLESKQTPPDRVGVLLEYAKELMHDPSSGS